jgi:hypothetical protein
MPNRSTSTVKKQTDRDELDARMQAGNVTAFVPRAQMKPARNDALRDPEHSSAAGGPPDNDPGPSAA